MNISKALKEKNKLAQKYQETLDKAIKSNCTINGAQKNYSSVKLLEDAEQMQIQLVELKTKIHIASAPVRDKIFSLSEIKSYLAKLKNMPCKNGVEKSAGYGGSVENTYSSEISQLELDELVSKLEEQIESIQEQLDTFNAITQI